MCVSGLLGVQAAQVQVQRFDTGSVSVPGRRQREAAAIVDALHALPAPGLCWPCTLLGCCVAAEGWAGVRLSYASRPRYACERCSAMRLARCRARLCRPARFPDGVVDELGQ
jgi:hypothetical protein